MKPAAFNTGSDFHLLDHVAPLASLLKMPLITTEETNFNLARRYYPHVEVRYQPNLELELGMIADEFDTLFESKYWFGHLKFLFQSLYRKEMNLYFCPHGQSDKGFQTPILGPYATQDKVLVYGELMIQMLKELNIESRHIRVGNYRLAHYLEHQSFYDKVAEQEIFSHLPSQRPNLLYAPTWKDLDQSTSFFDQLPNLIQNLSSDWNLLIKAHPLLEQREPAPFYSLLKIIEKRPNTLLIVDFPPIYPILARADAYLGDFSSVGYDFLAFQRPMFFLPHPTLPEGRLRKCGITTRVPPLSLENRFKAEQKALYELAFDVCHVKSFFLK